MAHLHHATPRIHRFNCKQAASALSPRPAFLRNLITPSVSYPTLFGQRLTAVSPSICDSLTEHMPEEPIHHPNDKLLKATFSNPDNARGFFENYLPEQISHAVD